jgi:hypothetical protein
VAQGEGRVQTLVLQRKPKPEPKTNFISDHYDLKIHSRAIVSLEITT